MFIQFLLSIIFLVLIPGKLSAVYVVYSDSWTSGPVFTWTDGSLSIDQNYPDTTAPEGSKSSKADYTPGTYGGWGIATENPATATDMSQYAGSSLKFWVKTSTDLYVGVSDTTADRVVLLSAYGWVSQTPATWQEITIPIADLGANMSAIDFVFLMKDPQPNVQTTWFVDHIRWVEPSSTTIYDFASSTTVYPGHRAWQTVMADRATFDTTVLIQAGTDTEFTALQYEGIAFSENQRAGTASNTPVVHRFRFKIEESTSSITFLKAIWEGYNDKATALTNTFYIWDRIANIWRSIGTNTNTETRISTTVTSGFDTYIDPATGYLYLCTFMADPGAISTSLYTDYVVVIVSYTTPAAPPADTTPPAAISNLTALAGTLDGVVVLKWTAPGDDETSGGITDGIYRIKVSTYYISSENFDLISHNPRYTYGIELSTSYTTPGVEHSYTITGLNPGTTYYFAIKTRDDANNWSIWPGTSAVINSQSFTAAQDLPLQPPPSVNASGLNSTTIDVSWTLPPAPEYIDDRNKYSIYRATYSFTAKTDPNVTLIATILHPGTTHQDTGLTAGVTYYYRIISLDKGDEGDGLFSLVLESTLSVTASAYPPPAADTTPPAAISNLTALTGTWGGEIILKWTAPGDDGTSGTAAGYLVKYATSQIRSTDFYASWVSTYPQTWTPLPAGSEEQKILTGFTEGTTYYFAIKAYDEANNYGIWNSSIDVAGVNTANFAPAQSISPATITTLSALPGTTGGTILLTWIAPGDDGIVGVASQYDIRYSTSPIDTESDFDNATQVTGVPPPAEPGTLQSMTVANLTPGTTYFFRMKTADERPNWSGLSNQTSTWAGISEDNIPPGKITTLQAAQGINSGEIKLFWIEVGDDEYTGQITGGYYRIQYSTDTSINWNKDNYNIEWPTSTVSGRNVSKIVTGLSPGVTYYFRIWTRDEVNWSDISNAATAWAQIDNIPPASITTLSALTGIYPGEIRLSWISPGDDGNSGTITGGQFAIQYSSFISVVWSTSNAQIRYPVNTVPGSFQYRTITGLSPGTTYYFRIWTADERPNWSDISNGATAWAQIGTPTGPMARLFIFGDTSTGFIGAFGGSGDSVTLSTDSAVVKVGDKSWKAVYTALAPPGGYAGYWIEEGGSGGTEVRNMTGFETGYLSFWLRCDTADLTFKIGIRSDNLAEDVAVWTNQYQTIPANTWVEFKIPISDFTSQNPDLDLKQMEVFFIIASTYSANHTFWVDDVRWEVDIPTGPDRVTVSGTQLLVNGNPYTIKGVVYNPIPVGYDYTYQWYNDTMTYTTDFPLMQDMGCNTIRLMASPMTLDLLNKAYQYGIKVIGTVWVAWDVDYSDPAEREKVKYEALNLVRSWKDHPAILMWSVGNEVNYHTNNGLYDPDWYSLLNETAQLIKQYDDNHPVTTANGDVLTIGDPAKNSTDAQMTHLDLWGANVYRGGTMGSVFYDYTLRSNKPLWFSEFGCDRYNSTTDSEDEFMQKEYLRSQWRHIYFNLSNNPNAYRQICVGGCIFEWSDEWWKYSGPGASNFVQEPNASWGTGAYEDPDGANLAANLSEEWWGIVKIAPGTYNRTLTQAYYTMKDIWTGVTPPEGSDPFSFMIELRRISDDALASSITFTDIPYEWSSSTPSTHGWKLANEYMVIKCTTTYKRWGVQIYTDNTRPDANPRYTGEGNPAGLIGVSNTKSRLQMAFAVFDRKQAPNDPDLLIQQTTDYVGFVGWNWRYMVDRQSKGGYDFYGRWYEGFSDGFYYAVPLKEEGYQYATDYREFSGTYPFYPDVYIYFAAKFLGATRQQYRTNTLTVEFFIP